MTTAMGRHRRFMPIPLAWVVVLAAVVVAAQPGNLTVERQGEHLRLSAPHFHFLEGRPLEQMHNGAAVSYVFSVTIEPAQGSGRWLHLQERFIVSYDLWEEKFAVVRDGQPRRTASHLTAAAAETWCLESLLPGVSAVPSEKDFVVKLACSIVPDDEPPSGEGLTLSTLIDLFSRKGATAPQHWDLSSAPLRLSSLKDRARH